MVQAVIEFNTSINSAQNPRQGSIACGGAGIISVVASVGGQDVVGLGYSQVLLLD